jgi:hypothetical protein
LQGLLAVFAFALLILSTILGSALFGSLVLADWSLIASQVCIWLAASVFLGYFSTDAPTKFVACPEIV